MSDEPIRREAAKAGAKRWIVRLSLSLVVVLALAGGAGYYAWTLRQDLGKANGELSGLRGEARTAALERDKAKMLDGQLAECKKQSKSLSSVKDNLETTRAELESLRKQREQTAKRLEAFKDLSEKLKKMIDSGRLDVVIRDGRMVVKLPASVLFDSGSAELSRDGELALMELAVALRQFPERTFMVEGHTDDRPLEASGPEAKYKDNWELSTARAVNVTRFLIEAKLPPEHLIAAGRGPYDPITDNRSPRSRQKNRRIEIVLLPDIEELPPMPGLDKDKGKDKGEGEKSE